MTAYDCGCFAKQLRGTRVHGLRHVAMTAPTTAGRSSLLTFAVTSCFLEPDSVAALLGVKLAKPLTTKLVWFAARRARRT